MTEQKSRSSNNKFKRYVHFLSSTKLTSICLVILIILIVWGTLYQVNHGLYQAQLKFFHSWFLMILGFIPFPGTTLVMFVLFINLIFSLIFRIGFKLKNTGNLITHSGIILLLIGSFIIHYYSLESSLIIKEGDVINYATSFSEWELAIWNIQSNQKVVYAFDSNRLKADDSIPISDINLTVNVQEYYQNCQAFQGEFNSSSRRINASGIGALKDIPNFKDNNKNIAGGVLDIIDAYSRGQTVLLYGLDRAPTQILVNNQITYFSLRNKQIILPFKLRLKKFKKIMYPNSTIPKSFESTVTLMADEGINRDILISMNKPLRYAGITLFQSSYFTSNDGIQNTVLAYVKSPGRLIPYYSCLIIFLGMLIHFMVMFLNKKKREI